MGLFPVIAFVCIAVPLVVIAYLAVRRSKAAVEHPANETAESRARTEAEFAAAEAYQEQWREEEKKHPRDTIV
jgi:type III secretory pathway component EscV